MGPELVLGEVLVVESVPEDVRGRAFAAMAVLTMLGMAVGYGVAGPMVEAIGARATIAWTAVAILALALLWVGPALRGRGIAAAARPADDVLTEHICPTTPYPTVSSSVPASVSEPDRS